MCDPFADPGQGVEGRLPTLRVEIGERPIERARKTGRILIGSWLEGRVVHFQEQRHLPQRLRDLRISGALLPHPEPGRSKARASARWA